VKKQAPQQKSGSFELVSFRVCNKSGVSEQYRRLIEKLLIPLSPSFGTLVLGFDYGRTGSGHIHHSGVYHLCCLAPVGHVNHLLLPHVLWIA
jgi:hypothetical protein